MQRIKVTIVLDLWVLKRESKMLKTLFWFQTADKV
jgi:hypothetical protein